MANDKSMFIFGDDQQHNTHDEYSFHNCPTPQLPNFSDSDSLSNTDLLASLDCNFDDENNLLLDPGLIDFNASMAYTNNIVTVPLGTEIAAFVPIQSPDAVQSAIYNSSIQPCNSSNNIPNYNTAFTPFQAELSREEDNKTPLISDTGNEMFSKNGRKDKCMTRNAVLARQNREKKKCEYNQLVKINRELEEKNATLNKQVIEYKNLADNLRERNTYLEAIIQNLPTIANLVEHMSSFPGNANKTTTTNNNKKT